MRTKIINRLAAGTIGVCFAYALIRQPFAVMKNPNELMTADWSVAAESTTQPTTIYSAGTIPSVSPTEQITEALTEPPTEIEETIALEEPETESDDTETITDPVQDEVIEDNDSSDDDNSEELSPQQNDMSGDVPTLSQFLSSMICGGCRHNCPLISPRCMKGRAKAESATVEYYETYGA